MTIDTSPPSMSVLTVPAADVPAAADFATQPDVRRLLGSRDPATWILRGQGLVGLGRSAEFRVRGGTRFTSARVWWDAVRDSATVDDRVNRPGTGLLAFGAFAFSPSSTADSGLVVPELVIGSDEHGAWVTLIRTDCAALTTADADAAWRAHVVESPATLHTRDAPDTASTAASYPTATPGALDEDRWMAAVADGVDMIRAGDLDKLVLARDVVVDAGRPIELSAVLARLSDRYDSCWTYCVRPGGAADPNAGRLLGATPEMLIRVKQGTASARVLAGTLDRHDLPEGANPEDFAGVTLGGSDKQQREHKFAVDSLLAGLSPYAQTVHGEEEPFILALPNVWHLASDVRAELRTGVDGTLPSPLELAEAVHPTAAVCGTPTDVAGGVIEDLERMDRGLYAGPVGWLDASGNGEWGIALRGAVQLDARRARVSAGCGIVVESDPRAELAETWAKLRPMLEALPATRA